MSTDGQGTKWRRNTAENFNRLGCTNVTDRQTDRRQTTDDRRQTNGRRHTANVIVSERSLEIGKFTSDEIQHNRRL